MNKPEKKDYLDLIEKAKAEDLAGGDVTSQAVIPVDCQGRGDLVFREAGVVCGLVLVEEILAAYGEMAGMARPTETSHDREGADKMVRVTHPTLRGARGDGECVAAGECVGIIEGPLWSLPAAEPTTEARIYQSRSGYARTAQGGFDD